MDLVALVERARAGDVEAFTELVREHQALAIGSALSVVRDLDRARDVVQEAFVAAWRGLARLAEPNAFPAWLHGIVRRQALHALRARHLAPLAEAEDLAGDAAQADDHAEAAQRRRLAITALIALPDGLREPALLRYVHDCSQAQIATFLDLPVTTVNNRLHAARTHIKKGILAMMKDTLRDRPLPEDFPARIGRIVRAEGPVVEARFELAGPPELFSTLIAADEAGRAVTKAASSAISGVSASARSCSWRSSCAGWRRPRCRCSRSRRGPTKQACGRHARRATRSGWAA